MNWMVLLKAILCLPIIFFIPGYITFNAFRTGKIENLKLSLFETLFLQVLASIVITGWIAFSIAEVGYFSLWILCGVLLVYSVVIAVIFRARIRLFVFPYPRWNHQSVFFILLLVLMVCLFFHPSEEINLEHDIGSYVNTGANIANTGSIVIHDPILSTMPDSAMDTFYLMSPDDFFLRHTSQWFEGMQFPGLPIVDKESGTVVPWKPLLQQIWFAIFYSIFGLKGALYSQSLLGSLGVLSVFLVGKTIWNWRVGAIASSLLAINYAQIFFSQYTSPVILFQLLAFAGIATFILFRRTHNGFFGVVSAMCFGQLFMTRIEAPLILIPLVLIVLYILFTSKQSKIYLYFIVPFLVLWFHSLAHINCFCVPYIDTLFANVQYAYGVSLTPTLVMASLLGISLIMAVVLLFAALYSNKVARLSRIGRKLASSTFIPYLLMLVTILLIVYLWVTSPNRELYSWATNLIPIPRDFDPIVSLSWFVGWLGLGLALFGLFLMLCHKPHAESYCFLGIVSLTLLAYLYTLANNPVFPWAMRRMITIVIPVIMILIGYSVERIRDFLTGTMPLGSGTALSRKLIMILLVLVLVVSSASMWHTLAKPQFEGFVHRVDKIADFFPADSIILEANSGSFNRLSVPLKYIYGKNAIYLWKEPTDVDEFVRMIRLWNQEGRDVYLVVWPERRFDSIKSKLSDTTEFKYETTFLLKVSKVSWEKHIFTNTREESTADLKIYRVIPR